MPSPFVSKLAKDTGKPEEEIEKLWDKAKKITADKFNKSEDDFEQSEYAYTTGIVKNMLGADEKFENPEIFLNSGMSAIEFIEDAMASGSFSIGDNNPVIPPKDDEEDDVEIEIEIDNDYDDRPENVDGFIDPELL